MLSTDVTPARAAYQSELEQLRLQVELMGVRVDQNLERMRSVLHHGDLREADLALAADDEIDAMQVSLTERCYDLLAREQPVASDLRLIVSVVRITAELERIGDLALRVVKLAPDHALLRESTEIFDLLAALADLGPRSLPARPAQLRQPVRGAGRGGVGRLPGGRRAHRSARRGGPPPPGGRRRAVAVKAMTAGQALSRIDDHATVLGARLRYLFTGDPDHLAAEVR